MTKLKQAGLTETCAFSYDYVSVRTFDEDLPLWPRMMNGSIIELRKENDERGSGTTGRKSNLRWYKIT